MNDEGKIVLKSAETHLFSKLDPYFITHGDMIFLCHICCIIDFSVKSGKHGTITVSLVQNRVRFRRKPAKKKYISLQTQKCTTFCAQLSFILVLIPSFLFLERLHCRYIYFRCSYMYNYYNYLEPCALNAEFLHFILRFNKKFLTVRTSLKEGMKRGPKTGWRQDDFNENSNTRPFKELVPHVEAWLPENVLSHRTSRLYDIF
jgi:hypothetical protein